MYMYIPDENCLLVFADIHFRANGTMAACGINAQGVNQHDLSLGKVFMTIIY